MQLPYIDHVCYRPAYRTRFNLWFGFFFNVRPLSHWTLVSVSDGQHQYRLLGNQFLIVSLPQGPQPIVTNPTVQSSSLVLDIKQLIPRVCTFSAPCPPSHDIYWNWWRSGETSSCTLLWASPCDRTAFLQVCCSAASLCMSCTVLQPRDRLSALTYAHTHDGQS